MGVTSFRLRFFFSSVVQFIFKCTTYHQINDDKPYKVGNSEIRNWNRSYAGMMSIRHALAQSLNVPAVKTLEETGYDKAKKFSEGLGIKFAEDKISIRDAIGGTGTGVTPLQLAGAANGHLHVFRHVDHSRFCFGAIGPD